MVNADSVLAPNYIFGAIFNHHAFAVAIKSKQTQVVLQDQDQI